MKILHIILALTKGGAERVAVDLANAGVRAGHDVSMLLAYPVDPALMQNELDPRVDVRFVRPKRSRFGAYIATIPFILRAREWLKSHDIVHCHLTFGSVFGTLLGCLRRRPTIVETYHAVGVAIPAWKRALHRLLLKRRDATVLMAEDEYWLDFTNRQGHRLVKQIPNGVSQRPPAPKADVAAVRRAAGVPVKGRLVGTVGRLQHERRPDALVLAFGEAARMLPPSVHFLVGGEGPERAALTATANRMGIGDRVHFCGLVRDPAAVFANLELYVTINVGPITGIAALEAAMSGLPVVAFQMVPGYVGGATDWIWSSHDPVAVGNRIVELMTHSGAREALAAHQQAYAVKHHSLDAMARAYDDLYEEALRGKTTRGLAA